jgi:zinc protease
VRQVTTRFSLPNGLTVVLQPQHAAPVVAFQVWVKVGSADETPAQVGLAHLHEHMLFKGTAQRGLGEIARSVEAHGGEINAWTSFDQTVYHVVMAARHARVGLEVLADAVRNSAFDEGELTREIEVVCEEIKRSLDMPARRASKALFCEAFRLHPYGRPVIGFEADVRAHTRERVLAFYRQHYRPSNIVLSCVGDFDEATLRAQVDELFGGDWARGAAPPPVLVRPPEPGFDGVRVALSSEEVKEAHLHLAFQIPGVDHADTAGLDVLAMLAGQGDASRLALEVRRKRALAKDVNAWAWTPKEPGLFGVALVAPVETVGAALEQTVRVLASLTVAEVDLAELQTITALIEAEAIYQRETVQGVARKLGFYEAVAGGLEREASYYEAIAQVTPASLRELAQRYLRFDRAVVTGLLPLGAPLTEADVRASLARAATDTPQALPARHLARPTAPRVTSSTRSERRGVTVTRLASGATVVVREERAVPLVAVRATWPGGLRFETPLTNGVTQLLSRTLTRGTADLAAEQVSHLVDSLAGSLGATAGRSSMSVRGEFLSKHFERGFELFADVATQPSFPQAEVARERAQLLQDVASRDDRPSSVAFELFAKTMYAVHPYRLSPLGERASLEQLDQTQLRAHHQQFLRNEQLTLVVVGDVDTDEVLARATARFGAASPEKLVLPAVPQEGPWAGPREKRRVLQRAQSHLMLGFPGATVHDPWRRPLEVLQTILSGQSGRLFLELRDRRSMAYSVSALMLEGVDPGYFAVYMGTSPEKVEGALDGIRAELARVRDELVDERELDRAREHLIGTQAVGLQRNGARAGVMALDACYGLGPEAYRSYAQEIAAVSRAAVREVAQRVIDFERSALAVVGA